MSLIEVPSGAVSLMWALGALRWKERIGGVTYAGICTMLGITTRAGVRYLVRKATTAGVVVVEYKKGRPVVSLSEEGLQLLEGALADG